MSPGSPFHLHKCHRCGRATLQGEKYCRKHIHLKRFDKLKRFHFTRSPEFLIGTGLALVGMGIGLYHLIEVPSEEQIHEIVGQTIQAELESSGISTSKTFEEVKKALGQDLSEIGQAVLDRLRAATLHQEAGQDSLAEEIYRNLIGLFPNIALLHFNLGVAYYNEGQLEKADGEWRKTIQIDPDHREAHLNLGILLAGQKKHTAALQEIRAASRLLPSDPVPHYLLGMILASQGLARAAVQEYDYFVNHAPDSLEFEKEVARQAIRDLNQRP